MVYGNRLPYTIRQEEENEEDLRKRRGLHGLWALPGLLSG
jgi:hypothetical protein